MDNSADSHTSPTLLGRLRQEPADQEAWAQLVERYGRWIYAWCRQGKLQDADAEDVTQMVLVRLAERMRTFTYDPSKSFRGWLRTLTRHAWSDFVNARQRGGRASGDSDTRTVLQTLPARDDLVARLEEQFDREVLEEATARVRLRVEPATWQAFQLVAVEGLSGAEVARRLERTVASVFKAKARVQTMLRDEVARLEGDGS
ncbi:MAG TPA: sigma-70 family RNA polymerase sigma factor [Gemmataceae bacterium]|nr:sigma-70 family RNA polymerase sigma factor [Gemmataceae bacterium]